MPNVGSAACGATCRCGELRAGGPKALALWVSMLKVNGHQGKRNETFSKSSKSIGER